MRVLFYGTPAFAVPTLEALLRHHTVVAAVTQPDRPAHRGQRLTASPVKERALAAGIPVVQPARLRDPEWPDRLRAYAPEVAVVVAFGQILPRAVLDVPPRGSHQRPRLAAPALSRGGAHRLGDHPRRDGDGREHHADGRGHGHGARAPDRAHAASGRTRRRASWPLVWPTIGRRALVEALARLDALAPVPQPHAEATLAPRLKKSDGHLDWSRPAARAGEPRARVQSLARRPDAHAVGPLLIWRASAVEATCRRDRVRSSRTGDAWPSPPAPVRSCRSRSRPRAGAPCPGRSICGAPASPPAPSSALRDGAAGRRPPGRWPLHVLERVARDGAFADLALEAALARRPLSMRDAALATELVYGTLRWQRYLDWVLAPHSRRALASLDTRVLAPAPADRLPDRLPRARARRSPPSTTP